MSDGKEMILELAVPVPLSRCFDYLPPEDIAADHSWQPGQRLRVRFGRREVTAILLRQKTVSDVARQRLRPAIAVLNDEPIWNAQQLQWLCWAARYYQHPVGEVLQAALPRLLRGDKSLPQLEGCWQAVLPSPAVPRISAAQQALLERLQRAGEPGVSALELAADNPAWRRTIQVLQRHGLVRLQAHHSAALPAAASAPQLHADQRKAVAAILQQQQGAFLLDGITGSGKTEVYLRISEAVMQAGGQVLLLVPEIGLTPQLTARFQERFGGVVGCLHSAIRESEQLAIWQRIRGGELRLLVGTRSALFAAFSRLSLIIVDEEHDASYKQQEGFRYQARDLAVMRAHRLQIPIVLGSATPSLESLFNVERGTYKRLHLPQRAGGSRLPTVRLLDMRLQHTEEGVAQSLLEAIAEQLQCGQQVLLFLNRRGYAPVLLCLDCGWQGRCSRCDCRLTYHRVPAVLRCHYCGYGQNVPSSCPSCQSSPLLPTGQGTERIEDLLRAHFGAFPVFRIDRDSLRRRGALEAALQEIQRGQPALLVGTQMLSKGHHFQRVSLVAILGIDSGLFCSDFRARERLAQQLLQVSGRAGRAEHRGTVWIQSHLPEHPLLQLLIRQGYSAFAAQELAERKAAGLPPYGRLVLLRSSAHKPGAEMGFLQQAEKYLQQQQHDGVEIWGPVAAPMPKQAGRSRGQLLLRAEYSAPLQRLLPLLRQWLESKRQDRRLQWSLDIDPVDLF